MAKRRVRNAPPPKGAAKGRRASSRRGSVLQLATRKARTVYPTTTVKQTCKAMADGGIRRVPVADSGTGALRGIVSARDLVDFFGGGEKYNIIGREFNGNLFAAVNLSVSKIMSEDVVTVQESDGIKRAAGRLMESGVGGAPVVDRDNLIVAFVSEVDFLRDMPEQPGVKVEELMSEDVISVTPGTSLGDAAKIMINRGRRRLPVVHDGELVGMMRATGILEFISSNGFARFDTADAEEILGREKVGPAMSAHFVTMRPKDEMSHLIDVTLARRMGGFPVEEDGRLVGIVTEHDVFEFAYSWATQ